MLLFLALLVPALAATLRGVINGLQPLDLICTSVVLRDIDTLSRQHHHVSANGSFAFYSLPEGKQYRLSLESDTLELPWAYHVVVKPHGEFNVRKVLEGRPLDDMGPPVSSSSDPLEITGYKRTQLVADRQTFSIWGFFTQPTVMLSIGALVLVTYLPTLLGSLDPELLAELEKNQLKPAQPQEFDLAKTIANRRVKK